MGLGEEDAFLGRNDGRSLKEVVECADATPERMRSLDGLSELHLVAYQNEVASRSTHRDEIAQRDLPRLVDEQEVELPSISSLANNHAVPATSCASVGIPSPKISTIIEPEAWVSSFASSDFLTP